MPRLYARLPRPTPVPPRTPRAPSGNHQPVEPGGRKQCEDEHEDERRRRARAPRSRRRPASPRTGTGFQPGTNPTFVLQPSTTRLSHRILHCPGTGATEWLNGTRLVTGAAGTINHQRSTINPKQPHPRQVARRRSPEEGSQPKVLRPERCARCRRVGKDSSSFLFRLRLSHRDPNRGTAQGSAPARFPTR